MSRSKSLSILRILACSLLCLNCNAVAQVARYDLVVQNGRVIDPETGLDAVRNVGIRLGSIVRISTEPLQGAEVVDARGLVVAPGFVNLHDHEQTPEGYRLKVFDGVTTGLEMEIGAPDIQTFLAEHEGKALINYGSTASHVAARAAVFGEPLAHGAILPQAGKATDKPATPEQIEQIEQRLRTQLDVGALGIGMGIQYTPGATRWEVTEVFRVAAERHVPIFVHVRSVGRIEPGSSVEAVEEVIAAAAVTGAPLHVAHINSIGLQDALKCIGLIAGARSQGLNITTEAYPYTAGMTNINSALFNPGWREKFGIDYKDLQLPETGERLTKETFEVLHASPEPRRVLLFMNSQEMVDSVIVHPLVMIASDAHAGHPRAAGTFSRILARYVREQGRLSLMDAVRKMTLMPATVLERATPAGRRKGRLQEGADADIVVFDLQTITDRATYDKPNEPSVGVKYLIVDGHLVIENGEIVPNVYFGRALTRKNSQF